MNSRNKSRVKATQTVSKSGVSLIKPVKLQTEDTIYRQWQEAFTFAEEAGGIKHFCVVCITNKDETLHYTSGGGSYRNMLGALEHLKLSFFLGQQD